VRVRSFQKIDMCRQVLCLLALILGARAISATVTADDYARAERLMPYNTEKLVLHTLGTPAWLPGGKFWYRTVTDRGTEYCGAPERHEYELYLAVENIDHIRTKTRHPQ